jgi:hypothetical protein
MMLAAEAERLRPKLESRKYDLACEEALTMKVAHFETFTCDHWVVIVCPLFSLLPPQCELTCVATAVRQSEFAFRNLFPLLG